MRRKPQVVSLMIFGQLLKSGGFKKAPYKNRWYQDVYVSEDASFIVVERRVSDLAGNPLVAFHWVNPPRHRLNAKNTSGYPIIHLDKTYTIHKIVAETFLGPVPDGLEIDHRDGDKSNNNVTNLEYVTHAENMRRRYARARTNGEDLGHTYLGRWVAATETLTFPDGTKKKMTLDEYLQYLLDCGRKDAYRKAVKRHKGRR